GLEWRPGAAEKVPDARTRRPLPDGAKELPKVWSEELDATAATVLEPEGEAAGVAQPGNRWRRKAESDRLGNAQRKSAVQLFQQARGLEVRFLSLPPVLELDEEESAVRRGDPREQAETDDTGDGLHPLGLAEDVLDLSADDVGPLEGGRSRQLGVDEEIA